MNRNAANYNRAHTHTYTVPPQFTATPEDIVVTEGQPFMLTSMCAAVGEPKPTTTWHRPDGTQIPVQNGVPQFGALTRADDGVFVCLAANSVGQIRHDFTITVQGSVTYYLAEN